MSEHTWAVLATMAENATSLHTLSVIVAALCKHNQGLPGGGGPVQVSDDVPAKSTARKMAQPARAKRRK